MPVLLLGLLVVLAGLAIGGLAGRLTAMHAHLPTSVPSISPVPTETPTLAPESTPTPKTTPTPKPTPSAKPKATPTAKPSPTASPVATVTPSAEPSATPKPAAKAAATPRTPEKKSISPVVRKALPSPTPAPAIGGSSARALVRVYLADLARGDTAGASALLASGSPDTFIDGTLQIGSVASVPTANGAQSVTAQIIVGVKHYTMSFLVGERGGHAVILSHAAASTTPALP